MIKTKQNYSDMTTITGLLSIALDLEQMGFELTKKYTHEHDDKDDVYTTYRFKKGVMTVEFTFDSSGLVSQDITLDEVVGLPVTMDQIKAFDKLLGEVKG